MAWHRLTAGPALEDLERPPASRALHAALHGVTMSRGELTERLRLGMPAFVDDRGGAFDAGALRALGIEVAPTEEPAALAPVEDPPLAAAWAGLTGWLEQRAPEALTALAPPALAADVEHVEARFAISLPADLRALWSRHDGQSGDAGPFGWTLDSVVRSLGVKVMLDEMFAKDDGHPVRADAGVRAVWWSHGWLPFTSNGAGDHLCIDLAPAPGGRRGQVIEHRHNDARRILIAPSVTDWIAGIHARLLSGELVVTDDESGRFFALLERASLRGSLATLTIRGESAGARRDRLAAHYAAEPGELAMALLTRLRRDQRLGYALDQTPFIYMALAGAMGGGPAAIRAALANAPGVERLDATVFDLAALLASLRRGEG